MIHFELNLQMLFDSLQDIWPEVSWDSGDDRCLKGFQIGRSGLIPGTGTLFLTDSSLLPPAYDPSHPAAFLSLEKPACALPEGTAWMSVPGCPSFTDLCSYVQDIFRKYEDWERNLYQALEGSNPLDEILEASIPIFNNPIFIHDAYFYILSCPRSHPRMTQWERDPHTGREMVPFEVINYFKADPEYLDTLSLTEPGIYSWEHRSYPILFYNLWNNGRYEGRICIDELDSPLRPGQHHAIAWMGQFLTEAIQTANILWLDTGSRLEVLFCNYLSGKDRETSRLPQILSYLNWERNDDYLLMRLEADQHSIQPLSSASLIGHIETTISYCFAFSYENSIVVIANLTRSNVLVRDLLSSLAILLREGLLKMGVSVVFHDFLELDQAHYQAWTALEMGKRSRDMRWCFRFDDYLLDYILTESGRNLTPELLASQKIQLLRKYDQENGTEFFRTLQVYLDLERNVLQTAKRLFIHRSTLFYRLSRIQQIAGVNTDDPAERLTLQLSYYILDAGLRKEY